MNSGHKGGAIVVSGTLEWGGAHCSDHMEEEEGGYRKGGAWLENPVDVAQLTFSNFSVQALTELTKPYSPTCRDSGSRRGVYSLNCPAQDAGTPLIPDQH